MTHSQLIQSMRLGMDKVRELYCEFELLCLKGLNGKNHGLI